MNKTTFSLFDHRYACRIEPSHVAHLFERYCLEPYSDQARINIPKEAAEDYPVETNHLLQVRVVCYSLFQLAG